MPEKLILPDIGKIFGLQFLSRNMTYKRLLILQKGEIDQSVVGFFFLYLVGGERLEHGANHVELGGRGSHISPRHFDVKT
jgi:hypothetical protein